MTNKIKIRNECKNCHQRKFKFIYGVKICAFCGMAKTKRGKEKLKNIGLK